MLWKRNGLKIWSLPSENPGYNEGEENATDAKGPTLTHVVE